MYIFSHGIVLLLFFVLVNYGFCLFLFCFCFLTNHSNKFCLFVCLFVTSLSIAGNSGRLAWVRPSSRKSSATHSYQCVQYFRVSRQWYGCQCLGFLTCTQLLVRVIARWGGTGTVRESADTKSLQSALEVNSGRKNPCHTGDSNPSSLTLPG